jgi:U3 small nucleolar RNA-associated protein 14
LSGWNSWAGDSKEIKAKEFLKRKRYQQFQTKKNINEKDSEISNPYVKINNTFDKKFSNYLVQELPRNVRNAGEFDRLNSLPLGIETNSLTMYKKLIQPSIIKKIGQIIEPMKVGDNTTARGSAALALPLL